MNKICVNSSAIRRHGGGIIILYRYTRRFNFGVRAWAFFSLDADGPRDNNAFSGNLLPQQKKPPLQIYLMNQTLGGPLVRALRARAGILLLIQRIFHRGCESLREQLWWEQSVKIHQKSPFSLLYLNPFIMSSYYKNTMR